MTTFKTSLVNLFFIISFLSVFLFTLFTNTTAVAGWFTSDYYAILQVAIPNSSLVKIIIDKTDSKKKCENALKDFWTGTRTSCPNCKLEESVCSTTLPPAYKDIFDNKSSIFPYVTLAKTRIIFVGVPLELGNQYCEEQAALFINKIHEQARCIRGSR